MGRGNLALVEAGAVAWDDVVTAGRVRSLREVADRNKLTVEQMVRFGVPRHVAAEAYDAVHTGAKLKAEANRDEAVRALMAKGYTRDAVAGAAAKGLAARFTLGGLNPPPAPPAAPAPRPTGGPPQTPTPPPVVLPVAVARLAQRLARATRSILRNLKIEPAPEARSDGQRSSDVGPRGVTD